MKLIEITPAKYSCGVGMCPGVYVSDSGYVVVGKRVDASKHLPGRVSPDEEAIEISRELLEEAIAAYVQNRSR